MSLSLYQHLIDQQSIRVRGTASNSEIVVIVALLYVGFGALAAHPVLVRAATEECVLVEAAHGIQGLSEDRSSSRYLVDR